MQPVNGDQASVSASYHDRWQVAVACHERSHVIRNQSGDAGLHGRTYYMGIVRYRSVLYPGKHERLRAV